MDLSISRGVNLGCVGRLDMGPILAIRIFLGNCFLFFGSLLLDHGFHGLRGSKDALFTLPSVLSESSAVQNSSLSHIVEDRQPANGVPSLIHL